MKSIEEILKKEFARLNECGDVKNPSDFKILIYTNTARAFRTTLIGYLFEIAQKYPVVLLSEKLDPDTERVVNDKNIFPKLEKIIYVNQFTSSLWLLEKNKYLFTTAEKIINEYKPKIVISESDMYSMFELYLMRLAKLSGLSTIAIQCTNIIDIKTTIKWIDYINAYSRFSKNFPLWFRLLLTKVRKYFGHFIYLWILPLLVGQTPFFGRPSFVLRNGVSGMRYIDYQIVFSEQSYKTHLENGVKLDKLYIIPHPVLRIETRDFFKKIYSSNLKNEERINKNILLLISSVEIGFKKNDWSIITKQEREMSWLDTIHSINKILPNWNIVIKPHPDVKDLSVLFKQLRGELNNVKLINPEEPVDKYIEKADIVLALPWAATTALFSAFLQCPGKTILAYDPFEEALGDFYKNFDGIIYIKEKSDLSGFLGKFKN